MAVALIRKLFCSSNERRIKAYCPWARSGLSERLGGWARGWLGIGALMPDTASAATSPISRSLLIIAAAVGILLAGTVALWAHYGTAVFYEMIVAGIATCL